MYFLENIYVFSCFIVFILSNFVSNTLADEGCRGLVDFVFVIDGSESVSPTGFIDLKDTLVQLTDRLHVAPLEARMGIVVYSSRVTTYIPLTGNKTLLRTEIWNLKQPGMGTNTALGIDAMRTMFIDQYKTKGVPKVGIVITDGDSQDPGETLRLAFLSKNDGVNMFAVGVSGAIDRIELTGIATNNDQVLTFDTFGELSHSTGRLVKSICPASLFTTWTTTTTTIPPTTTTTSTTTTTPPTTTVPFEISTMAPIAGPCDNCKMENGVGFNPHPEDCDKFTQCYFGENNEIQAAYRQCPFGQYWAQNILTCIPAANVNCVKEKCRLPGLLSYPYGTIKNNRGHWKCNLGKSVAMCCPDGYLYRPYQGCEEHDGPTDPCPPNIYHEGACDSKPIFGNLTHYDQYVAGHGWLRRPCAPGTHYNPVDCACTFHASYIPGSKVCEPEVFIPFTSDVKDHSGKNTYIKNVNVTVDGTGYGYFNGNAKLVIPRFSNFETYTDFVVKMRYFDGASDRLEALLSNGDDCCDHIPSLALVKSTRNVHYMAKCDDDTVSTFHLPSMPGQWNEVFYMHDGLKLEGRSNGIRNEDWAVGKLKKGTAGLQIGHGRLFQNFRGYMDYVAVYLCRPSYL